MDREKELWYLLRPESTDSWALFYSLDGVGVWTIARFFSQLKSMNSGSCNTTYPTDWSWWVRVVTAFSYSQHKSGMCIDRHSCLHCWSQLSAVTETFLLCFFWSWWVCPTPILSKCLAKVNRYMQLTQRSPLDYLVMVAKSAGVPELDGTITIRR